MDTIKQSTLQPAMLFELAVAVTEQSVLESTAVDWDEALKVACFRQRQYFDAKIPQSLALVDKEIAQLVSSNLQSMLADVSASRGERLLVRPKVPGYGWIASGHGDFGTLGSIIEVKCTRRRFSTADYRQLTFYWLLSYLDALEKGASTWTSGILLNPRLNFGVEFEFDDLLAPISERRSLIDVVERFRCVIDESLEEPSALPLGNRNSPIA
ncbi:MAG: hypothetical protein AAGE85_11795 [Pseudomonadota bacterium]